MRSRRAILAAVPAPVLIALGLCAPPAQAARTTPRRHASENDAASPRQAEPAHANPTRHEMELPRDHGAHPEYRTEWWYITGHAHRGRAADVQDNAALALTPPDFGFQVTFFRTRLPHTQGMTSNFAARQLVFAHAAVTDLRAGLPTQAPRFWHEQRMARVSGHEATDLARFSTRTTQIMLRDWRLERTAIRPIASEPAQGSEPNSRYTAVVPLSDDSRSSAGNTGMALELMLTSTQPVLLQGQQGWSRKGPSPEQISGYLTEPQLRTQGVITAAGERYDVVGRAWLDHEWSNELLAPGSVGWDWIGMNLDNGAALTAFRIRGADGNAVWDGGSHRTAAQARKGQVTSFTRGEVVFRPVRHWRSPASGASYPVEWIVRTPIDFFTVRALHDAQELDSRRSTGAFYWEGLCELLDGNGQRVGRGYLEMTGYAAPLRL